MHNLENKSKFIVVINGYFTRDGQVFCPENLEISHNEEDCSEEFYNRYEQDDDWRDICHKDIYLGMYEWLSDDICFGQFETDNPERYLEEHGWCKIYNPVDRDNRYAVYVGGNYVLTDAQMKKLIELGLDNAKNISEMLLKENYE